MRSLALLLSCAAVLAAGCSKEPEPTPVAAPKQPAAAQVVDHDEHSYAEPQKVAIADLALDIAVDFDARTIGGTATYTLDWVDKAATQCGGQGVWLGNERFQAVSPCVDRRRCLLGCAAIRDGCHD